MRNEHKRRKNEKKFGNWIELANGDRRYYYDVLGRHGWRARYVKEVDASERTTRFYQQIFEKDQLVEIHAKYPIDKGHKKVQGGK